MNIAIIGSGSIGTALARRLIEAGHQVTITSRSPASAREAAEGSGATVVETAIDAVADAAVVFLAVPWDAVEGLAHDLAPVAAGKIVVDVTNPMKPDGSGPLFGGNGSGAERLAAWLPGARIVKAFNTIFGSNLAGGRSRDGFRLDGFVAADDPDARMAVLRLATELGFDPIDVGPLTNAGPLEALAWLNISLNIANGWPWQSGWKLVGAERAILDPAA